MSNRRFLLYVAIASFLLLLTVSLAAAVAAPRMSPDELKLRIGEAGVIVLDVRASRDWNNSNEKIFGAVRIDQRDLGQWAESQDKGRTIVLYCA